MPKRDISLDITGPPSEPPSRSGGSRTPLVIAIIGAVIVAIAAGVILNPFGSDAAATPSSVKGLTFWSGGDSTSYYMSAALTNALVADGAIALQPEPEYENGSGLLSPDFFDWPAHIRETVVPADPDIVVFMIGANDARDGFEPDAYRAIVAEIMDALNRDGRYVIWLGQPNMGDPDRAAYVRQLNEIFKSEADNRAWVRYIDTYDATSTAAGEYAAFTTRDGADTTIREEDGLHFTPEGGALLADLVLEALGR